VTEGAGVATAAGDWGGRSAFYARLGAALVSWLPFVAEQARRLPAAAALIAGLALVSKQARRHVGERRRCTRQREETGEEEYYSFASHGETPFSPGASMI
jgi:hypothetical protein